MAMLMFLMLSKAFSMLFIGSKDTYYLHICHLPILQPL